MIVRNESRVIERCLRSVAPYVDRYCIVDTGSTDDTPERIARLMEDFAVPGQVHFQPWVNFGLNRQGALELALAVPGVSWMLFIDADEELEVSDQYFADKLARGVSYDVEKRHSAVPGGSELITYRVPHLIDVTANSWRWEAPVHNYLVHVKGDRRSERLKGAWILYHPGEGAKSHGVTSEQKYLRDAALLEAELLRNPGDARSAYYLGQSYKDAGRLSQAYAAFDARVRMPGYTEETFMAQLQMGRVAALMGNPDAAASDLLDAYALRPTRAEPLYELARLFRVQKAHAKAYLFAKVGSQIPRPDDALFVLESVYSWRLLDELGIAAYWIGAYSESADACLRALAAAPEREHERIRKNLAFATRKLKL